MEKLNIEQAVNVIKQVLDATIKAGVCQNLEATATLLEAWKVVIDKLKEIQSV